MDPAIAKIVSDSTPQIITVIAGGIGGTVVNTYHYISNKHKVKEDKRTQKRLHIEDIYQKLIAMDSQVTINGAQSYKEMMDEYNKIKALTGLYVPECKDDFDFYFAALQSLSFADNEYQTILTAFNEEREYYELTDDSKFLRVDKYYNPDGELMQTMYREPTSKESHKLDSLTSQCEKRKEKQEKAKELYKIALDKLQKGIEKTFQEIY